MYKYNIFIDKIRGKLLEVAEMFADTPEKPKPLVLPLLDKNEGMKQSCGMSYGKTKND